MTVTNNLLNTRWWRGIILVTSLLFLWWLVTLTGIPAFLLPSPMSVISALWYNRFLLVHHSSISILEIIIGLVIGVLFGGILALLMIYFPFLQWWLMPLVIISQVIPVFALAPLLVLWFGYGVSAKVAMAVLIIFFPIVSSFYDGLHRVNNDYLDLARLLRASSYAQLRHVRLMAALPELASGLRMAAAAAPIGTIIGEWIGSAEGLGYLMLNANARMQTDMCFAALLILVLITITLWTALDMLMQHFIFWIPENSI